LQLSPPISRFSFSFLLFLFHEHPGVSRAGVRPCSFFFFVRRQSIFLFSFYFFPFGAFSLGRLFPMRSTPTAPPVISFFSKRSYFTQLHLFPPLTPPDPGSSRTLSGRTPPSFEAFNVALWTFSVSLPQGLLFFFLGCYLSANRVKRRVFWGPLACFFSNLSPLPPPSPPSLLATLIV